MHDLTDALEGFSFDRTGAWGAHGGAHTIWPSLGLRDVPMADCISSLAIVMMLMKQMESTIVGLRHLRECVPADVGSELLDAVIEEGEARIDDVQRRLAL